MDSTQPPAKYSRRVSTFLIILAVSGGLDATGAAEWKSGIVWPEPPVVDPGPVGGPPSDAIVLFDGKDLSQWNGGEKWLIEDGVATARGGGISTKDSFGDCQLHVEWASPSEVKGSGQGRGNSGVYMMGKYEVQILDSYNNGTYFDGQAGAIYKQSPPMVNACRPPGEWQTFDVIFRAPRFADDGSVKQPAAMTVLHNGVVIQNHFELAGATAWHKPPEYQRHAERLPISIQFHGNPVKFRNIWVRELVPIVGTGPGETEEKPAAISGRVVLDGEPVQGAVVTFHDGDTEKPVSAETNAEGAYALESVAPGTYKVTIEVPDDSPAKVPERYGQLETSELTVKAMPGKNVFAFELRSE